MGLFLTLATALTLLILTLLLLPLLRGGQREAPDRREQNIAIARERLRELESRYASGEMTPPEFETARAEIERMLGLDLEGEAPAAEPAAGPRGRWLILPLLLMVPLLATALYLALGNPAAIGGAARPQATAHEEIDVEGMVARLAARLEQEPDNAEGWAMLGRSYMALRRYPEAASAFGRLRELVGDDPRVLVRLADALAMSQQRISGQPARLLRQALNQEPDNVEALWMLGLAQAEKGRYREALELWGRAERQLQEQPAELEELHRLMEEARTRLGEAQVSFPGDAVAAAPPAGEEAARGAEPPATAVSIPVEVTLAPELAGQAPDDATIFVFARALQGPPMPLAVVRRKLSELPLKLSLDDSMAMMPRLRISAFPKVKIEARISLSGQARAASGDLQATPVVVETASPAPVRLVIDQRVP